ncbi:Eukaryotic translation initiation factor 3 subunit A [Fasciola hepatica]|uniref:Thioredoxin domain-containing protein 17 n=1 Tax=Fasciola hepatica TaxID=6192 RepID=A0A4E0RE83_FASHE|nr:Eukaryotic translation initiation factor 3 subunit A [Fasciola hepatica]
MCFVHRTMPAEQKFVESIDDLLSTAKAALQKNHHAFVFFSGSTDLKTGDSWCLTCQKAEPVLEDCLKFSKDGDVFMMIEVGTESEWKSPDNKFRTHPVFQLKNIPTVVSLKLTGDDLSVVNRIESTNCHDKAALEKLLNA